MPYETEKIDSFGHINIGFTVHMIFEVIDVVPKDANVFLCFTSNQK